MLHLYGEDFSPLTLFVVSPEWDCSVAAACCQLLLGYNAESSANKLWTSKGTDHRGLSLEPEVPLEEKKFGNRSRSHRNPSNLPVQIACVSKPCSSPILCIPWRAVVHIQIHNLSSQSTHFMRKASHFMMRSLGHVVTWHSMTKDSVFPRCRSKPKCVCQRENCYLQKPP